jgi:excisionase family DNA binding protein
MKRQVVKTAPPEELWTIHQVAAFLNVPVGTLYQWRHRGVGPHAYRVGRHLRYDPAAVRRWLLEGVA